MLGKIVIDWRILSSSSTGKFYLTWTEFRKEYIFVDKSLRKIISYFKFLYVLEYVLLHGWKQKVSMFNRNKSFWAAFDNKHLEAIDPVIKETNRSVKDMPGIKTGIGRARAFLRLALMQKKLPDYLDALQGNSI